MSTKRRTTTRPTALLFDADGVVQRTTLAWLETWQSVLAEGTDLEAFFADLAAHEKPCAEGKAEFAPTLAELLARWPTRASYAQILRIWEHIAPNDDVIQWIDALRTSGLRCYLATNQHDHRARIMTKQLKMQAHFDDLLFSCSLGATKPSLLYFERALQRLALPPTEIILIDDSITNIQAARTMGIPAIHFHYESGLHRLQTQLAEHGIEAG